MAIAILQGVGGGKTPQQKSIKIIENGDYSVHSDEGYELERVDVSVDIEIEAQKKTLSVTKDGTYTVTPDDGYLLSEVTLNVDTPDVKPEQEKKLDITADGDYTVTPDSGYVLKKVSVSVNTPDQKVEQEKSLDVTADGTYTVTPDSGKVLSKVTFNVDTPDKIPEQTKTLDVTKDGTYTVKPDSGKVLSEVTVNVDTPDQKPEMVKTLDITSNGTHTLTPDAGYVFKGVTVNVAVPSEGEVPIEYTEGLAYTSMNSTYYGVSKEGWEGAEVLSIPPTWTSPYSGQSLPVTMLTWTSDFQDSFQDMTMIKRVYADSITESESYSPFAGCTNLEYLSIRGLKMTVSFMFSGLTALKEVKLKYIKDIAMGTFSTRSSPCRFDFSECTHIPTLADTTVFGELVPGDQIVVPAALYSEWLNDTTWSYFWEYIVAAD